MSFINSDIIKKLGQSTGAGQSSNGFATGSSVSTQLSYPPMRSAGFSSVTSLTPEYPNGLIFTASNQTDFSVTGLQSSRQTFRNQSSGLLSQLNSGAASSIKNSLSSVTSAVTGKTGAQVSNNRVATILMPPSSENKDRSQHKFNGTQQSRVDRAGGSLSNFISNAMSDVVASTIDSATGGWYADKGEQLYSAARSSFAGSEPRNRTYVWETTPETPQELQAFLNIWATFNALGYGTVHNSVASEQIASEIKQGVNSIVDAASGNKGQQATIIPAILDFVKNAQVISNPIIWYVKSYKVMGSDIQNTQTLFGPAVIESVELDQAVDGVFRGTNIAPNVGATLKLTVTMREVIALTRGDL